ncbi:sulfatase-like hydrolase/transferase [Mesorhizobium sp. KR1-2]|uniref:sulfatase-like hydrolase/transferase n=1 Tax=Mesorhizobium sp. KR1-2 TaxID=3156609 RepID=UPI0032B5B889
MIRSKRIVLFLFLMSFFYPLRMIFDFHGRQRIIYIISALFAAFVFKFYDKNDGRKKSLFLWSLIPVIFISVYVFVYAIFGAFDFGAVVYHLQSGMHGGHPEVRGAKIFYVALSLVGFLLSLLYLKRQDRRFHYVDISLALALIAANPIFWTAADFYLSPPDPTLTNFYAAPPKHLPEGVKKKNIIIIYAESEERTFAEISHGSETFAEMLEVAATGIDVQGIRQVTNTGWTMAGFISSQCGVPLQPRGLFSENNFSHQVNFFGGIECLSDILGANGYHTEYMNGGDAAFAGIGSFLDEHKYSFRSGLADYREIAGDYLNTWGLYDDTLFELAEKRIDVLQKQDKPFAFSMATIGGHAATGHATRTCRENLLQGELSEMQFAIKCTGYHIKAFLAHLKQRGLLENTLVAIQSDHLIMENEHSRELNSKRRMNYFSISGDGIAPAVLKREAAMFDVFPTLLQELGMELPGGRAGLGVSLFAKEPNLVETYGVDKLDGMLRRDWMLSRKLWGDPET